MRIMGAEGRRRRPGVRMLCLRWMVLLNGAPVGGGVLREGQNGLDGGMRVCCRDAGGRVRRRGSVRGLIRLVR